ncbi:MAG: porin, partial [Enterobacterales bacterium]|nr:porin [Enterobacterales bacterium]
MKTFNKTLLASAVGMALASTSSYAEIELGKGLSVTGFVDMSFVYTEYDGDVESDQVFGVDQVEVDFLYSGADGVSAQVDIEYGESSNDGAGADDTFVEQAFITKKVTDEFSVTAGRFLSYSGWETEEPTGLYQYSGTGYGGFFYGGYQQGITGYYDGEVVDFMASFVNDAFDPVETDNESISVELGVAVEPVEGVTAKLFYIDQAEDEYINFWTSYSVDAITLAVEYNTAELEDGTEGDGYLLMGNYASGKFGFTVRYHAWEVEDGDGNTTTEADAITLAPSYAMTDNLLLVAEYR